MLFSHSTSDVWLAPQMSPMKLGQLCGHSCLRICTSTLFILPMKSLLARYDSSEFEIAISFATTYPLIPSRWSAGRMRQRVLIASCGARAGVGARGRARPRLEARRPRRGARARRAARGARARRGWKGRRTACCRACRPRGSRRRASTSPRTPAAASAPCSPPRAARGRIARGARRGGGARTMARGGFARVSPRAICRARRRGLSARARCGRARCGRARVAAARVDAASKRGAKQGRFGPAMCVEARWVRPRAACFRGVFALAAPHS